MRYMMLMYSGETPEGPSPDEVEYLIHAHGALLPELCIESVPKAAHP